LQVPAHEPPQQTLPVAVPSLTQFPLAQSVGNEQVWPLLLLQWVAPVPVPSHACPAPLQLTPVAPAPAVAQVVPPEHTWHAVPHATLQQIPLTQWLLAQSPSTPHAEPFAALHCPDPLQATPAVLHPGAWVPAPTERHMLSLAPPQYWQVPQLVPLAQQIDVPLVTDAWQLLLPHWPGAVQVWPRDFRQVPEPSQACAAPVQPTPCVSWAALVHVA